MTAEVASGSFRDPSGFVFFRDGRPFRQVNRRHEADYRALMDSGLYDALVADGLLVAHEDVGVDAALTDEAYTVIAPEPIPFVSHPYEWCFGQLQEAARATLRIQEHALEHGMSLRDASAYNIQFRGARPVLIDTLSFERLQEGEPWVAYRQFCQHFLAPLALMSYVDVRLSGLLRTHIDGVPLDLAAALLPARARLRPSLGLHLALHARSQRRHAETPGDEGSKRPFSEASFRGLIESLRAAVGKLGWEPPGDGWTDYYEGDSYTEAGLEHKRRLVESHIGEVGPAVVWDLGANTGLFSQIAADAGATVVAFDADVGCVESAFRWARDHEADRILPLYTDLTNPSPALGWAHRERASLVERGPADLALALALVHHLAIGNNVPLERIAEFLASVARSLVIEFVPKDDPKTQLLLQSREDIFDAYTRAGFEAAFKERFDIQASEQVTDSGRVVYLMRGR